MTRRCAVFWKQPQSSPSTSAARSRSGKRRSASCPTPPTSARRASKSEARCSCRGSSDSFRCDAAAAPARSPSLGVGAALRNSKCDQALVLVLDGAFVRGVVAVTGCLGAAFGSDGAARLRREAVHLFRREHAALLEDS